ncbi:MAG: hypothetical protein HWN79_01410 [Candidatus Lokiarchaeota archaeon]|nr:hypothetical protein [Candidatus Lokiarchaeota archaeon]
MTNKSFSEIIIERYGKELYKKSVEFPKSKINIISLKEDPIKIRAVILDNEREYHLIINENKNEIFHDCPTFLIHSEIEDKICIHLIKLLTMLKPSISLELVEKINKMHLTSEDFGSKKKSTNYLKLANICINTNNCVEGLSYLDKAIINQRDCEPIIERFLKTAIENNLFIEFFEFLQSAYINELGSYILKYNHFIERGIRLFLKSTSKYSFFEILRIIDYIDKLLDFYEFQSESFVESLIAELLKMANSKDFNERYFSMYFIKRKYEALVSLNPLFKEFITSTNFKSFKNEITTYFKNEIENFSVIDKLKLMKKQFNIFEIPRTSYLEEYKSYKTEIKELEKKVYLKKFAFLRLLKEKYNIKKSKIDFRKKRNTYIVNHNKENLENPAYHYIINHIGFYGINDSTIKSSEIGVNYLIIKELFLDDLHNFPDIFYYKKQFWGEDNDYEINYIDVFSLISKPIEYNYDIDQDYSGIDDLMIIEWDLANKPRQSSLVNAYGAQIVIPDQNTSLYHDLKPFDLCYCQKTPVKIEGNIIKTINVITKCSFKDAISSIEKGIAFIEGYYPLSLLKSVLIKKISPFEAYEIALDNPNKQFVPNYGKFLKALRTFLFNFINREKEYIYETLKTNPEKYTNQFIILLNLSTEMAGLELPYTEIINDLLYEVSSLDEFRIKFMNKVHSTISKILKEREMGSSVIFDIKKMRHTPFVKYSNEILKIRKEEFEQSQVYRFTEQDTIIYNMSELVNSYYGKQFSKILNLNLNEPISQDFYNKILNYSAKLNLKLNMIEEEI